MFEKIMMFDTYQYILYGIGVLGLLLKLMANTYLKTLIKESENMEMTKNRKLKTVARKCKNRAALGMLEKSTDSYVEKNVGKIKLFGRSFSFYDRCGRWLSMCIVMMAAGGFLYYDISWRGSPNMTEYFANCVIVCAFLLALENIFCIRNKMDLLKANIGDFIDNISVASRKADSRQRIENPVVTAKEAVASTVEVTKEKEALADTEGVSGKADEIPEDELIGSFLKEFFS